MSKNNSLTSDPAGEDSSDDSVFDFLYSDHRRIGSLLAQFEPGHLQQIEQTKTAERGKEDVADTRGKLSVHIAEGEKGAATTTTAGYGESSARTYDPYWTNARAVLDYLTDNDLIGTDIVAASLGEFVLVAGHIFIIDTTHVHQLYARDTFRHAAVDQATATATENQQVFDFAKADIDHEVVATMAPQVQVYLRSAQNTVWSTMRPEGLVTPPTEIAAKHGVLVDGRWHMLGIKDANPDTDDPDGKVERFQPFLDMNGGRPYMMDAIHLGQAAKNMFGRPMQCFGVTPLLIFRKVGD